MELRNEKTMASRNNVIHRDQLLTVEHLEAFKEELITLIKNLVGQNGGQIKKWMKSIDVRKLLGISAGTLQNLRVNGSLPYTKMGGVLYYDYEDIKRIFSSNRKHNNIG